MYNKKNMQNKYHAALANCFNKKKTIENDIKRFQNIHKKFTPIKQIFHEEKPTVDEVMPTEDIYNLNDIQLSTNISLNFEKENVSAKIPKIHLKDIIIPLQNQHDNFDMNNINNNISTHIHMNIFIGDEFNEGDINRLKKKNVTTLYNIYQQKYANNVNVSGFGDFIRGCVFFIQFCNKYNFKYEILIHHPIAMFLQKFHSSYSSTCVFDKLLYFAPILY